MRTFHREIDVASRSETDDACQMLTELYIGALLVDEELADLTWEAWNRN